MLAHPKAIGNTAGPLFHNTRGLIYGGGHNELLIAQAIKGRREKVVLLDKSGGLRSPDGDFVGIDGRPAAVKNFLTYTLRLARLDPQVPIEDTIGSISDLIKAGYVRYVCPRWVRKQFAVHTLHIRFVTCRLNTL
jgi:hypothetical protein